MDRLLFRERVNSGIKQASQHCKLTAKPFAAHPVGQTEGVLTKR
jgi:hypothetical protein